MELERLQLFSGFEANCFSRLNVYLLARARIASDARLARLDVKYTETAKFNALAASESVLQSFKNSLDSLFGLGARNVGALHDCIDDIEFDHGSKPLLCRKVC